MLCLFVCFKNINADFIWTLDEAKCWMAPAKEVGFVSARRTYPLKSYI